MVFLFGIATSNSLPPVIMFIALLSFSTDICRGPFEGYVPVFIAALQGGRPSALVGLMQILGNVTGDFLLITLGVTIGLVLFALMAVAIVELADQRRVSRAPGPQPVSRAAGPGRPSPVRPGNRHPPRALLRPAPRVAPLLPDGRRDPRQPRPDLSEPGPRARLRRTRRRRSWRSWPSSPWGTSSRRSRPPAPDGTGRKPIIYFACLVGGLGVGITALAPSVIVAIVGVALFGLSAGMFLAVDSALMTDIIPMAAAGGTWA